MPSLLCLALSNAVVATLLALLAVVVARFCRRPAVRHALWLLVLLKLITPPLLPLSVTWPQSEENEPPPAESPLAALVLPPVSQLSEPIVSDDETNPTSPQRQQGQPLLALRAGEVLIVVWLGAALTWWTVAAVRLRRFRRLLRQAQPAATDVQEQGRRMAVLLGLRRCPPIVFVPAPLSPMLWALGFAPRLLVPAELWQRLTTEQQDTLLAHELSHLRRGDQWVRRLELLILGLYWWHPVVWWARRRLQEAEEECCDDLVVAVLPDAAPAYASALVETVTFLSQIRPVALVGASGAGHVPLLKRRLTMILTETSSRKPSRIGFWIVLGLGALLLPLAPQAAQTQSSEKPNVEKKKSQRLEVDFGTRTTTVTVMEAAEDNPRKQPSSKEADHSEEIEKLQDDIELLKVQVQLKEIRRDTTKNTLNEYERRLANYTEINKRQRGTIPTDTLMGERLAIITHKGQLRVNEAELQETLVRLKQAERRLARLQRPQTRSDPHAITNWNVTWADALFDKRSVDLGAVKQGVSAVGTFRMTNNGKYPVHISRVRTSAACLKATASAHDLPPGGSALIVTQLFTDNLVAGKAEFVIHVQFDKPDRQQVTLEVRANVQAADAAKPQSPERLQQLEKKLDELRKEMDNLRREMRPDRPRDPILQPDRLKR